MKQLVGFTLTEIIISLAISSLVVLSGLSVYYISYSNSINFYKSANKKIELLHLLTQLQNDFEYCESAIANGNTLSLIFIDNSVDYKFSDSMVIINSSHFTDTLTIVVSELEFTFDNKQVVTGLVNQLLFSTVHNNMTNKIFIMKKYAANKYP
ncbi:MAG: prepilin-type N-terminal cleavage/methylation domain-containing protein [Bacteroidota bacterium]